MAFIKNLQPDGSSISTWKFAHGLTAAAFVVTLVGCSGNYSPDIVEVVSPPKPEAERLSYFTEINAHDALSEKKLTGKGVRVTIMGEMVDAVHPELIDRVVKQYNAFSKKGSVLAGPDNQVQGAENLGPNDGHGTHIAGTIAAACDGLGIRGLACEAKLDVYNLGSYDSSNKWPSSGWGDINEYSHFMGAFTASIEHLTKRGKSRIVTGSFNLEAPAIRLAKGGKLQGKSIDGVLSQAGKYKYNVDALIKEGFLKLSNPLDREFLKRVSSANDDDEMIALSPLFIQTREWEKLADAIAAYQAKDGVYIITESNNNFEDRTSVFNAMPTLSDKVDPQLWLSVVMVQPENADELLQGDLSFKEYSARLKNAAYLTPLNSCGEMAKNYCIVTPSSAVLSTMTERTAFRDAGPLYRLDGRIYQTLGGHSMGAPMVAATLALMEENNIRNNYGYTMRDLVRILKDNANRSFKGYDPIKHGRGMLDISAAINAMKKT